MRGICIFGVGDLPLLTSRRELFANKFFADFEPLAYDCLEEWHWRLTLAEVVGEVEVDVSWYRELDIVKHKIV